ncbi:MAG: hypothetical protein ABIJ86_12610 [Spirochaetota bacterium]
MVRTVTTAGTLRKSATLAVLVVLLVFTGACWNPAQTELPTGFGKLELNLGGEARSVLPIYDYAYAMDFYQITGVGPDGAYFEVAEFTGILFSIVGLEPGSWEVSVTALNAMKEAIARSSFQATILADQTTTANPLFLRLDGSGSMDLSLCWYTPLEYTHAEAQLEDADSQPVVLDQTEWTITETAATFTVSPLPAGSYTLTLSLWEYGQDPISTLPVYTSGTPVSVEIYAGHTSKGVFTIAPPLAAPQDFLYHPDRPVHAVDFGSGTTQKLTVHGAAGRQLYLVKVNPSGITVNAQATGSASSTWEYLADSASTSEPTIYSQPSIGYPDRREHEAALLFNANPPPIPDAPPARSLARTIAYGETTAEYVEGITKKDFWVEDENGDFKTIPATLRAVGRYSYVWIADDNYSASSTVYDDNKLDTAQAKLIRDKFDGTFEEGYKDGIFRNVSTIFGHEFGGGDGGDGGRDGDQHISILLHDIAFDYSSTQTGGIFGYFWSKDYDTQQYLDDTYNAPVPQTNYAEIFYLDAHFADKFPDAIYSTMAHEYQHMIHFNMKSIRLGLGSKPWFNEMCSMVAEDLVLGNIGLDPVRDGPQSRLDIFTYHYAESGLIDWLSGDEVLKSYAGAFAFGAYLARNFGGAGFFHELLHNDKVNEAAIDAAMAAPGALGNGQDFSQELLRYGEALVLTANPATEGLRSLNRGVTSFVADDTAGDGISYTALPINLGSIQQYDLASGEIVGNEYGLRTYHPLESPSLRPYGSSIHTQASWTGISGELALVLEAPGDSAVRFFLIVR